MPAQVTGGFVQAAAAKQIPVNDAAITQAEQGSAAFGLALLRSLGASGQNMAYSPQTLVDLLGMMLPGAQGTTATALAGALGEAGLSPDTAAAALGRIDATARGDANQGSNTLDESSDVWSAVGLTPTPDYLAALDGAFGTGVHETDFVHDPGNAETEINNLVAQETHGYIKQLFGPKSFDASTLLVLTDAVYLNATWAHPFDPNATSSEPFHPSTGAATQVSMMDDTDSYQYTSGNGCQLVELPYAGGKLAMDVLLPTEGAGTLAALRNTLTVSSLNSMLSALTPTLVNVQLPKFTTNYTPDDLRQALSALGLGALFTSADLGGMFTGGEKAHVSQIVEQAQIQVAEKGTVAAAAAGGAMAGSAAIPVDRVQFTADHPFLYLIRDLSTGQLLFAGQYTSP
jgi:serpin B